MTSLRYDEARRLVNAAYANVSDPAELGYHLEFIDAMTEKLGDPSYEPTDAELDQLGEIAGE